MVGDVTAEHLLLVGELDLAVPFHPIGSGDLLLEAEVLGLLVVEDVEDGTLPRFLLPLLAREGLEQAAVGEKIWFGIDMPVDEINAELNG